MPKSILLTTARKFKGLEASIVFLIDVDISTFWSEDERRVFYVGSSRAKNILEIVSIIDNNDLPAFYKALSRGETARSSSVIKFMKSKLVNISELLE